MDQPENCEDLVQNPAYQLWLASNAWVRWVKRELSPLNITHVQYGVLRAVDRLGSHHQTVSQAQVSRMMTMDENMVSQVIRLMSRRGLLIRQPDPRDRRAQLLTLSQEGQEMVVLGREAVDRATETFFGILDDGESKRFLQTLHKLIHHESMSDSNT